MQDFSRRALALVAVLCALAGCAPREGSADRPVEVVTVVVTQTPGPTQTPVIITEVQTVVVVATAEPSASPSATLTATVTETATPEATERAAPPDPSATASATPTATATSRPTHTRTPEPVQTFRYEAPRLTVPANRDTFSNDPPTLRWEPVPLGPDEYYEVTIERLWQNQPYYAGSDWVREPQMAVPSFVRGTSDTTHYTWWVTIKRLTGTNAAGGKVGEAISPPSEQRTFTWQPG